jgi:hypothetical protein
MGKNTSYTLLQFTSGYEGLVYEKRTETTQETIVQVLGSDSVFLDEKGNPIDLPDAVEYRIVEENVTPPFAVK